MERKYSITSFYSCLKDSLFNKDNNLYYVLPDYNSAKLSNINNINNDIKFLVSYCDNNNILNDKTINLYKANMIKIKESLNKLFKESSNNTKNEDNLFTILYSIVKILDNILFDIDEKYTLENETCLTNTNYFYNNTSNLKLNKNFIFEFNSYLSSNNINLLNNYSSNINSVFNNNNVYNNSKFDFIKEFKHNILATDTNKISNNFILFCYNLRSFVLNLAVLAIYNIDLIINSESYNYILEDNIEKYYYYINTNNFIKLNESILGRYNNIKSNNYNISVIVESYIKNSANNLYYNKKYLSHISELEVYNALEYLDILSIKIKSLLTSKDIILDHNKLCLIVLSVYNLFEKKGYLISNNNIESKYNNLKNFNILLKDILLNIFINISGFIELKDWNLYKLLDIFNKSPFVNKEYKLSLEEKVLKSLYTYINCIDIKKYIKELENDSKKRHLNLNNKEINNISENSSLLKNKCINYVNNSLITLSKIDILINNINFDYNTLSILEKVKDVLKIKKKEFDIIQIKMNNSNKK